MKCPLIKIVEQVASATLEVAPADCLKEECAWWDDTTKVCAMLRIAMSLNILVVVAGVIKDKMPHLEQFKRA